MLTIDNTRIDRYNKIGVLEDAATGDTPPLTASGVDNRVTITQSHIIGRIKCQNFPQNGNCSNPAQLTTGPLFGQDGVRVSGGSRATLNGALISQNGISGTGFPTRSTFNTGCTTLTNNATNNANLPLGAGVRLIGAAATTINQSNLVDNAYAVNNLDLDGTTANTTTPVSAENNWWGMNLCRGAVVATPLLGPQISPTNNPPLSENPVNGTAVADATCTLAPGENSTTVDFCPHRVGPQSDPSHGQFNVDAAPIPVNDAGPSVSVSTDTDDYDRGDTVTVSANAGDDFGIKKVTFYDGANPIGTDSLPPYSAQRVIPQNAPCAERTMTAVAEDSFGQTASDSTTIEVVGPNSCISPPGAPDITFDNPPSSIPQAGVTVTALPVAPAGVDNVEFFLGTRSLCTDDVAPYTCQVLANGDEVGAQTLRAVVTDDAALTAEAATPVTVEKFDPAFLGLAIEKQKVAASVTRSRSSGTIQLPPRVAVEDGCASGAMTITVERNGLTLFPSSQVGLQDDCTYELKFRTKEKKGKTYHYDVDASFGGNGVLNPISDSGGFSSMTTDNRESSLKMRMPMKTRKLAAVATACAAGALALVGSPAPASADVDPAGCENFSPTDFDPTIRTFKQVTGFDLGGGAGTNNTVRQPTSVLYSYLDAIVADTASNPRVRAVKRSAGTTWLGRDIPYLVIGTPTNITNLDTGRNDAAFWRGVRTGGVAEEDALNAITGADGQAKRRRSPGSPATSHGNEPAGGEGVDPTIYELVARRDCANMRRLENLDAFMMPSQNPDGRDDLADHPHAPTPGASTSTATGARSPSRRTC